MQWIKTKESDLTDEELFVMARSEMDQEHTAILFSRYFDLVYGLCLKYCKNEAKAKDAVMDIYELYSKKIKTHQVDKFKSWLYVLSKNHCLEKLRKAKWKEEKMTVMQFDTSFHPYSDDDKEDDLNKLENCIKTLDKEQKQCIQLFYLEKQSYNDISDSLQIPWNTIRSLIQNGRRNLKNCMNRS